jgi:hypothetical protein
MVRRNEMSKARAIEMGIRYGWLALIPATWILMNLGGK